VRKISKNGTKDRLKPTSQNLKQFDICVLNDYSLTYSLT